MTPMEANIKRLFLAGKSYTQIAAELRTTKGTVAGRCRVMGLRRDAVDEPAQDVLSDDRRDIDILHDLDEGHSVAGTAKHWGVKRSWVRALQNAAGPHKRRRFQPTAQGQRQWH